MSAITYTKSGTKATANVTLPKQIFSVTVSNHDLLKKVYLAQLNEKRNSHANVKTRGLVRGGGRKPWRQKGTGRARFGSIRNPIWRGGGIVFGPTGHENYKNSVTKRERHTALNQALTLKKDSIKVIESFECKNGKTSEAASLIKKLDVTKKTLIVIEEYTDQIKRATNNLKDTKVLHVNYLSARQVLDADTLIFTKKALVLVADRQGVKDE